MVKVFTEIAFSHSLGKIFIGCTYESDVDIYFLGASQRTDLPFLKSTEQLYLHLVVQVSHFIQEECAAISHFKSALLVLISTGKGSLCVSEKF